MNRRSARTTRTVLALPAITLALSAAALSATACGDDPGPTAPTVTVTAPQDSPSAPASAVDAADALETALNSRPGSYAVEIDAEDGRVWEVTLVVDGQGTEVTVDASTGEVSGGRVTGLDAGQREAPSVTAADAVDAALAGRPGVLDSLDLDREAGQIVWDATVIDGTREWDIRIDATSGEILRADLDD